MRCCKFRTNHQKDLLFFSSNVLISLKKYIIPTKFQPESQSLPVLFMTYYSCISLPFIWNSTRQGWEQPFKSSPILTREWWFIKLNTLPTDLLTNRCPYRTVLKWSAECMEENSSHGCSTLKTTSGTRLQKVFFLVSDCWADTNKTDTIYTRLMRCCPRVPYLISILLCGDVCQTRREDI